MSTKFIVVLAVALLLALTGCMESEQAKLWGVGDPPAEYMEFFGNDNGARLNYMQNLAIERLQAIMYGVEQTGKDGKVTKVPGLAERVGVFEKLNSQQHLRMGKTDVSLHERLDVLEEIEVDWIELFEEMEEGVIE